MLEQRICYTTTLSLFSFSGPLFFKLIPVNASHSASSPSTVREAIDPVEGLISGELHYFLQHVAYSIFRSALALRIR